MRTQKEIQSKINTLRSRLNQIKTSHHFKDDANERAKLISKLEKEIANLENQLDEKDSENL